MKRILGVLLLCVLLLPGMALAAEEKPKALEVYAPGFDYYSFGTEAAQLVRFQTDGVQTVGELFILEDGYLSGAYELDVDVYAPFPAGKSLTCLNSDLSVRWTLADERLTGAWYMDLLELDDALVMGSERSEPEHGQAPSVMLVEKETGEIRWQMEGDRSVHWEDRELVWISDIAADVDGNILVGSNGDLHGKDNVNGIGTLSLLDAKDGSVKWSVSYLEDYGVQSIRDICLMGGGLLLYGSRAEDKMLLYTDRQGTVRSWFAIRPMEDGSSYTSLWLCPVSEDTVYLCGWEVEQDPNPRADLPYHARTLYMMRLDAATFQNEKTW